MTATRHVYVSPDLLTRLTKNQRVGTFEHFNDFSGYWLNSESTSTILIERPDCR